jgi:hypothetical protein
MHRWHLSRRVARWFGVTIVLFGWRQSSCCSIFIRGRTLTRHLKRALHGPAPVNGTVRAATLSGWTLAEGERTGSVATCRLDGQRKSLVFFSVSRGLISGVFSKRGRTRGCIRLIFTKPYPHATPFSKNHTSAQHSIQSMLCNHKLASMLIDQRNCKRLESPQNLQCPIACGSCADLLPSS